MSPILLVDNHDSYTYNLVHLVGAVTGEPPLVVPADEASDPVLLARVRAGGFSHVVISPGPGTPEADADFGGARAVLEAAAAIPVLGVCLGHQGIGLLAGARVEHARRPVHGHVDRVRHSGEGLFAGLPQDFAAVRYHSLHVVDVDPQRVRIHARTPDGVVMGLEVLDRPHWGVQFHPESVLSEHGEALVRSFLSLGPASVPGSGAEPDPGVGPSSPAPDTRWRLRHAAVDLDLDCEATFARLRTGASASFWLDPAGTARFSILGTDHGEFSEVLSFDVASGRTTVHGREGSTAIERNVVDRNDLDQDVLDRDVLEVLRTRLSGGIDVPTTVPEALPFTGGYVGFLGYECAGLTLPVDLHSSSGAGAGTGGSTGTSTPNPLTPDAVWIRPQAFLVVDHEERRVHLCALEDSLARAEPVPDGTTGGSDTGTRGHLERLRAALVGTDPAVAAAPSPMTGDHSSTRREHDPAAASAEDSAFREEEASPRNIARATDRGAWRLSRDAYLDRLARIDRALHDGDSYEVCLTDTFELELDGSAVPDELDGAAAFEEHPGRGRLDRLELYAALRRRNPAPYGAYVEVRVDDVDFAILSSSPERFLRVDHDRTVTSKPIKGTVRRSADPREDADLAASLEADPKTRAENLMIVDLLRHDLSRVCELGSVMVPLLMDVESYATVHQLVSTVRGQLRPDADLVDLLHATFPGGSMTGAPKERTVSIIHELEPGPRGVYSGTLGHLGFDGRADLDIVIRTIVAGPDRLSVAAGGAIVLDSEPDAEFAEKELKATALLEVVDAVLGAPHPTTEGARP